MTLIRARMTFFGEPFQVLQFHFYSLSAIFFVLMPTANSSHEKGLLFPQYLIGFFSWLSFKLYVYRNDICIATCLYYLCHFFSLLCYLLEYFLFFLPFFFAASKLVCIFASSYAVSTRMIDKTYQP